MTAAIAAAGSGERLRAGGPKAFVPLNGRPMIEWSIAAFREAGVEAIVLAVPPGVPTNDRTADSPGASSSRLPDDLRVDPGDGPTLLVVDGGETRAESVSNALAVVETDLVAIHDAARPLVTAELIRGVVEALHAAPDADAAIAAAPVTDTIKQAVGAFRPTSSPTMGSDVGQVEKTIDRRGLWAAQTPQVFRADALREAIESMPQGLEPTDEAMIVEAAGGRVLICESSAGNLKVTTRDDLALAELLIARRGRV